jgi:hypothetical protein
MKIYWMLIFVGFSAASFITATPSLNSKCGFSVVTPQNGAGVLFDESCSIAYVLPPKLGRAEVGSLARTTNLQFCPAVKSASQVALQTFRSMNIISERIEEMLVEYEPLNSSVQTIRMDLATTKINMDLAAQKFADAENELDELKVAVREAKENYKECVEDESPTNPRCIENKALRDAAKEELKQFHRHEYKDSREALETTTKTHKVAQARYEIERNRYVDAVAPMMELQQGMSDLNTRVMELYREYTRIEGATGQITWTIGWDQVLENYRKLNLGLRIEWRRLPLKESDLVATIKEPEMGMEIGISALKSAIIPGARKTGFAGMGAGETVALTQTQSSPLEQAAITFGDSMAGQIVLTLAGACPYFDGVENRNSINSQELANNITANLIYTYDMAARRGYIATYNLSSLLTRVEEESKDGGLFWTSSAHSIIEDSRSDDWFSISFSGNTSDFQYSEAEQNEITKAVKQELMDKALAQFAVLNAGSPTPPPVPEFVESGASTASSSLKKCWYLYCQVGSAILGVANAIWGSSNATANFHRNNSSWVTEHVNGLLFVSRSGSLTFSGE